MATLIGVVSQVVGEVFAVAGDGTRRALVEGDRVYAGEQLVTGAGGAIALTLVNGEVFTLGRDSSLTLNEQLLAGGDGSTAQPQQQDSAAPSDDELTDVEQLQAAIEAGVDPTLAGEATAEDNDAYFLKERFRPVTSQLRTSSSVAKKKSAQDL